VDLRLGNASGIDLIRELKRDLPDLMVVLCSGYLSVAAAVAAVRAGADIVVFKPITFREILQRIEESTEEPDLEDTPTLARAEWEHIMRVLADCNGNVSMAARRLGIYRSSLQRRLRKYAAVIAAARLSGGVATHRKCQWDILVNSNSRSPCYLAGAGCPVGCGRRAASGGSASNGKGIHGDRQ